MDNILSFVKKSIAVAVVLFLIRYAFSSFDSLLDIPKYIGQAISVTTIIMTLYNLHLWKFNPLEKIPRIMGRYCGNIEYKFNGTYETKESVVEVKQTLLSTGVKITTDEITSNTIVSSLIQENGDYVLYYTYITNPKSKFSEENPIQYGTCRLTVDNDTELCGTYWTSRKTVGDIHLKKC